MSLSDLAALGSFVSGAAVLASLVFLFFQMRQMTEQVEQAEKNQRALISQGVVNRTNETNRWLMQPDVLKVALKMRSAETDWSDEEVLQCLIMLRNMLSNAQDVHVQHTAGLVDQITYDQAMLTLRLWLGWPAARAGWKSMKANYASDWAIHIDRLIQETPLRAPYAVSAQFRENLAEILA